MKEIEAGKNKFGLIADLIVGERTVLELSSRKQLSYTEEGPYRA